MFCIFGKNSKIQKWQPFWGGENFWKIADLHLLNPVGQIERFRQNRSISTVKEYLKQICTLGNFWQKFRKSPKMAAIFGDFRIFAKNGKTLICFYLLNPVRDRVISTKSLELTGYLRR